MKSFWIVLSLFIVFSIVNATDVVVPSNKDSDAQESWTPPIDSLLAAGDTVRFVNDRTPAIPVNVPYIGIFGGTDGKLYYKTVTGAWDSVTLISGGMHQWYVNKISPRSAGLGIRVKTIRK